MPYVDTEEEGLPDLDEEDGRVKWGAILLAQDEWCDAIVVYEGENMVLRLRYADGRQELFDLAIRRQMEVCGPTSPQEEMN